MIGRLPGCPNQEIGGHNLLSAGNIIYKRGKRAMETRNQMNSRVREGIKIFAEQKLALVVVCAIVLGVSLTVYSAGTIPYSFRPGEKISADQVNANFTALQNRLVELEQGIARAEGAPVGAIVAFAGTSERVPAGWFICDGREVSRFKEGGTEFADLFLAIGVIWGVGDGSLTYNLPDLRGVFLRGSNTVIHGAGTRTDNYSDEDFAGRTWANDMQRNDEGVGSFEMDELEAHTHEQVFPTAVRFCGDTSCGGKYGGLISTTITSSTGGRETRPKNAAINYIIKY
ncbi:MAG: tail fiber protein [Spirochaetes bacterium]|nr:MAG: tail fiber protein [Spirochaetota bacterium]